MATLLPPNATKEELAIEGAMARVSDVPVPIADLMNPDTCPTSHLPWLAWALSVDVWDSAWPEDVQRAVIKASFKVHLHKGTIGAVRRALEALALGNVTVAEWFEYGGDPGYFKVDVDLAGRGLSEAEFEAIEATALNAKNERSWLDALRVHATTQTVPLVGTLAIAGEVVEVFPHSATDAESENAVPVWAVAATVVETVTVEPMGA